MTPDPYKPPVSSIAAETLQGGRPSLLWNPIMWLVLLTALLTVESAYLIYSGEEVPRETSQLGQFIFGVLLAFWVHADRRKRAYGAPFEFEAFVVFLWPIAVPHYLYRTRGWRGLLTGGGVWLLYFVPALVSVIVYAAFTE